jgi:hypothetical protein
MDRGRSGMSRNPFSDQAWRWLLQELERWSEAGRQARFWWRDDDATEAGGRLDRLLALSLSNRLPLSLAVIPARLKPGLVDRVRDQALVSVLQHGYEHVSHAAAGQRKIELGGLRSRAEILADLQHGYQALSSRFGASFKPVLVPPWNRIDAQIVSDLTGIGFSGLSTMKARRSAHPAPGLLQVNTHLDPVNWRHRSGFVGVYPAIAVLVQHLQARRSGYRDPDEPSGILTHHLTHNEAVWRFVADLLACLREHPAARFVGADDIWQ